MMPVDGTRVRAVLRSREQGATLVVALVMLVAVLMLGASAARVALQGEKASRGDRDRQIALQAAEAGLMDAELDIEGAPGLATERSHLFSRNSNLGFHDECAGSGLHAGLCLKAAEGRPPVWQTIDIGDTSSASRSVPYGQFTGQILQVGDGPLPATLPRYIIELIRYNAGAESASPEDITYFYRITAIGFGPRETTRVVLQTFYRKDGK